LTTKTLTIVDAIKDENLFLPFFNDDLSSWQRWLVVLKAIEGIKIKSDWGRKIIKEVTGRDADKLNPEGYQTSLILTGRRSGKSRIAAVISAYYAALAGLEARLAPGEQGLIACVAPTKLQSRIVRGYIRSLYDSPMLAAEVVKERTLDSFTLRNGNRLELLASDYRSVRGFSLLAVVIDEIAFLGLENTSRIRTDSQLVTSLQPALATTGGKLIAISSPYAKTGWAYTTYQKHFGNDSSQDVLVVNAPSRTMNPTLPQSIVDKAKAEDLASALSEYEGQFRDDVMNFVSEELIANLVAKGRFENIPRQGHRYHAFCDLSGGRNDAAALCIGHKGDNGKVIIDLLRIYHAPHNPHAVIVQMSVILRQWNISKITADCFAGEFASAGFASQRINYTKYTKNKSELYAELLPLLSSGTIELLDNGQLIKQLCSLERRTRPGGRDIVDHPKGAHDDAANAVAGCAQLCNAKRLLVGAAGF
jgi:hypothetical protein